MATSWQTTWAVRATMVLFSLAVYLTSTVGTDVEPAPWGRGDDRYIRRECNYPKNFARLYEQYYNTQDMASFKKLCFEDAKVIYPNGEVIPSFDDYAALLIKLYNEGYDNLVFNQTERGTADKLAYGIAFWNLTSNCNSTLKPITGIETWIFERAPNGRCLLKFFLEALA